MSPHTNAHPPNQRVFVPINSHKPSHRCHIGVSRVYHGPPLATVFARLPHLRTVVVHPNSVEKTNSQHAVCGLRPYPTDVVHHQSVQHCAHPPPKPLGIEYWPSPHPHLPLAINCRLLANRSLQAAWATPCLRHLPLVTKQASHHSIPQQPDAPTNATKPTHAQQTWQNLGRISPLVYPKSGHGCATNAPNVCAQARDGGHCDH